MYSYLQNVINYSYVSVINASFSNDKSEDSVWDVYM